MVFRNNLSWCHVVKHPLNLTSIEGKNRGNLPQLRWSSIWQSYLICFRDWTKEFTRHTCYSKKLRGIQFLHPNWLLKSTVGTANIVSLFSVTLHWLHPYFTSWSWILMRWKSSFFSSNILHGRWRWTTKIPISASLNNFFGVLRMLRSSHAYVFYKSGVPQNVAKFTEKQVCRSLFLIKLSLQLY